MIIWIGKEHFIRASEVCFDLVRRRVAKESGKVIEIEVVTKVQTEIASVTATQGSK